MTGTLRMIPWRKRREEEKEEEGEEDGKADQRGGGAAPALTSCTIFLSLREMRFFNRWLQRF